ncbi:MAG: hypothetical protein AAB372_00480 [Patescibacteria group bacterium]
MNEGPSTNVPEQERPDIAPDADLEALTGQIREQAEHIDAPDITIAPEGVRVTKGAGLPENAPVLDTDDILPVSPASFAGIAEAIAKKREEEKQRINPTVSAPSTTTSGASTVVTNTTLNTQQLEQKTIVPEVPKVSEVLNPVSAKAAPEGIVVESPVSATEAIVAPESMPVQAEAPRPINFAQSWSEIARGIEQKKINIQDAVGMTWEQVAQAADTKRRDDMTRGVVHLGNRLNENIERGFGWVTNAIAERIPSRYRKSSVGRFLIELRDGAYKNAERTQKSRLSYEDMGTVRKAMYGVGSIGSLVGKPLRWGAIAAGYAVPPFMLAMSAGRVGETAKGARFKNETYIEDELRVKDADEAAEEAWALYEEAKKSSAGGPVSAEALGKTYEKKSAANIAERLGRREQGYSAFAFTQRVMDRYVRSRADWIAGRVQAIEENPHRSRTEKDEALARVMRIHASFLRDADNMISQAGVVDLHSARAYTLEKGGKGATLGLTAGAGLKFWSNIYSFFDRHPLTDLDYHVVEGAKTAVREGVPIIKKGFSTASNYLSRMIDGQAEHGGIMGSGGGGAVPPSGGSSGSIGYPPPAFLDENSGSADGTFIERGSAGGSFVAPMGRGSAGGAFSGERPASVDGVFINPIEAHGSGSAVGAFVQHPTASHSEVYSDAMEAAVSKLGAKREAVACVLRNSMDEIERNMASRNGKIEELQRWLADTQTNVEQAGQYKVQIADFKAEIGELDNDFRMVGEQYDYFLREGKLDLVCSPTGDVTREHILEALLAKYGATPRYYTPEMETALDSLQPNYESSAGSFVLETYTLQKGDSPIRALVELYKRSPEGVAKYLGVEPGSLKIADIERLVSRRVVGEYLVEYGQKGGAHFDPKSPESWQAHDILQRAIKGWSEQHHTDPDMSKPEVLNGILSKIPKKDFNLVLHDRVPNLVHAGDVLKVNSAGDYEIFSPKGDVRSGHIPEGGRVHTMSQRVLAPEVAVSTPGEQVVPTNDDGLLDQPNTDTNNVFEPSVSGLPEGETLLGNVGEHSEITYGLEKNPFEGAAWETYIHPDGAVTGRVDLTSYFKGYALDRGRPEWKNFKVFDRIEGFDLPDADGKMDGELDVVRVFDKKRRVIVEVMRGLDDDGRVFSETKRHLYDRVVRHVAEYTDGLRGKNPVRGLDINDGPTGFGRLNHDPAFNYIQPGRSPKE